MMEPDAEGLSAYELERRENMRRNEAVLASLGLDSIVPAAPPPAAKRPRRRDAPARKPAAPARRSSRIEGSKAPERYVESETARGVVTVGGEDAAPGRRDKSAVAVDPLDVFAAGEMPEGEEDLLEGERAAFAALRAVKNAKARELEVMGYKVCQNRSLCEMVRRVPDSVSALRDCWGFGGSGVRVQKYGAMFLETLAPYIEELRAVHADAARAAEDAASDDGAASGSDDDGGADGAGGASGAAGAARAPSAAKAVAAGATMPAAPEELLDAEQAVYVALVSATHVRAEQLNEKYPWNIAHSRSLCEIVRRLPTSDEALRKCWGFGGGGVRAARHGEFLLDALRPHLPGLRAVHDAAGIGAGGGGVGDVGERGGAGAAVPVPVAAPAVADTTAPRTTRKRAARASEQPPRPAAAPSPRTSAKMSEGAPTRRMTRSAVKK